MLNPKIKQLNNKLTVVMDHIPHVESATVGVWSNIGSRVESLDNNGICHFLEHMVFKGTKSRNSFEISEAIENQGGYINAWTSKEKTAWYVKALSENINDALEIILDILLNSTFPAEELEKERGVILEEIKKYQDDSQDVAYNLFDKITYKNHSLSYPIIGSEHNIKSIQQQDFFSHMKKYYTPSQMVVSISGNFKEHDFLAKLEELTNSWHDTDVKSSLGNPEFHSGSDIIVKKEIEQTNVVYGFDGVSYKDEDYYKYLVASTILGGGMSSRLFSEIREKRGLAYTIYSFVNSYADCGSLLVYTGCSHDKTNLVLSLVKEEINNLTHNVKDIELERAKNMLKSSLVMSLESTYNRADRFAHNILNFGKIRDINEIITSIDSITKDNVINVFNTLSSAKESKAVVSNKHVEGF